MTEMDQTNTPDGAGGATSPPNELEQAQVICVIGKAFSTLIFPCHTLLNKDFQAGPVLAKARNAQDWSQTLAFRTCPSATFSEPGQTRYC